MTKKGKKDSKKPTKKSNKDMPHSKNANLHTETPKSHKRNKNKNNLSCPNPKSLVKKKHRKVHPKKSANPLKNPPSPPNLPI